VADLFTDTDNTATLDRVRALATEWETQARQVLATHDPEALNREVRLIAHNTARRARELTDALKPR
jgi:hypothetical protein